MGGEVNTHYEASKGNNFALVSPRFRLSKCFLLTPGGKNGIIKAHKDGFVRMCAAA